MNRHHKVTLTVQSVTHDPYEYGRDAYAVEASNGAGDEATFVTSEVPPMPGTSVAVLIEWNTP